MQYQELFLYLTEKILFATHPPPPAKKNQNQNGEHCLEI